jgi:hypothetical protein
MQRSSARCTCSQRLMCPPEAQLHKGSHRVTSNGFLCRVAARKHPRVAFSSKATSPHDVCYKSLQTCYAFSRATQWSSVHCTSTLHASRIRTRICMSCCTLNRKGGEHGSRTLPCKVPVSKFRASERQTIVSMWRVRYGHVFLCRQLVSVA